MPEGSQPLSFAATVRTPLATALAFSLAINLALLTPSLFMLQVFDRVLSTRSIETLVMLAAIAVVTLGAMGLLEQLRSRTLAAMGIRLEQEHGERLLRRLLTTAARGGGAAYLDGMRDLATVRAFLSATGVIALFDAPWIAIYIAVIALFDPLLGALALGFALLLLALAWANERATRSGLAALHATSRLASRQIDGALRQAEVIAALGMPGAVARRWHGVMRGSHGVQLSVSRVAGTLNAASRVARQMVQVVMLGVGAWLVIERGATAGVMLAATIILGRALAPVELLIGGWKALVDARAAYRRLRPLLDAPDDRVVTELPRPAGRLDVEQLSYAVPGTDRVLLHNVSFSVKPGQALAVVGASGAGKTTLARLLAGVMPPSAGSVRVDGADLALWSVERRGQWLGYLPQNVALFDGTVADNIARLGDTGGAASQAVLDAAKLAHAHEMILRLPGGYDCPVGEDGSRLSGGQRQRVALARAVFGRPALVVLDEADASLDAEGEQALLDTIRALKAAGSTVIVISQRRAVLSVADGVIVMKDGRIERVAERNEPALQPNPTVASVHGAPAPTATQGAAP